MKVHTKEHFLGTQKCAAKTDRQLLHTGGNLQSFYGSKYRNCQVNENQLKNPLSEKALPKSSFAFCDHFSRSLLYLF